MRGGEDLEPMFGLGRGPVIMCRVWVSGISSAGYEDVGVGIGWDGCVGRGGSGGWGQCLR